MNAETSADWRDEIFEVLQTHDIKQVYHVPDAGHSRLIEHCQRSNSIRTVPLTTEEEGIALAAGAWLGGQRSALLMQSSGVGNTINMMGLTKTLRFPFLTLITMRGDYGEFNSWQYPMGQGTPKVLEAMGVLLYSVDKAERGEGHGRRRGARGFQRRPVGRRAAAPEAYRHQRFREEDCQMSKATLQRRPLVKKILEGADDNLLVIAGLGSSNWDITEAGDRPLNMPLWGAMGAPVSMGLGLALAQPAKRVLVITGDADLLMSLGSLATVATQQPDNLAIVVLDNEKFGETGNQASHTSPRNNGPTESGAGADLAMIAKGCGIADVGTVREAGEVAQLVKDARTKKGPVFRLVKVMVEKLDFVMPPQDGAHLKDRFRQALLGHP